MYKLRLKLSNKSAFIRYYFDNNIQKKSLDTCKRKTNFI